MALSLLDLPYPKTALEPYISSRTLEFHHGKHHSGYIANTNRLIGGTDLEKKSLETIIKETSGDASRIGIFNNAAQVWNHSFYWQCMKPNGGGSPRGMIKEKIDADFGSYDKFVEEFKTAAIGQFGSGWAWLILKNGNLEVIKTSNADTPFVHGLKPLLTVDVWEHAYYLDYQNKRPDYVSAFVDHLINWDFVNRCIG
ncbi:MAG TPA: superoxide dismutase [Desulfobacterales bacterium]|nr:superoxide dismutase [Desulfobacterales bacterium]